ncbi:hypothetical protein RRG08_007474 [Elysia crispata]|uniref:Uncharacterized protein n=1 Tax=Elysia crispata TaxID=231223 RepID=A0AAE1CIX7_9GAST|nr:hypothetical protein RRG08_007474 [Elysia crispata]
MSIILGPVVGRQQPLGSNVYYTWVSGGATASPGNGWVTASLGEKCLLYPGSLLGDSISWEVMSIILGGWVTAYLGEKRLLYPGSWLGDSSPREVMSIILGKLSPWFEISFRSWLCSALTRCGF